MLRRPQNFAKSPPYFCLKYKQAKVRRRCGLLRIYELYLYSLFIYVRRYLQYVNRYFLLKTEFYYLHCQIDNTSE